ncbi:MAG: gamma-glutamyltransferase [Nitrospinota bacterium]
MLTQRPLVMGRRGVVASGHHLASLAGVEMYLKGGNAADAAIAAAAALAVVRPHACGIGGDVFLLVATSGGSVHAINGSGPSPRAVNRDLFPEGIPVRGPLACTIPGCVDGWCRALEKFGTLAPSEILQPAIRLADEGFRVYPKLRRHIEESAPFLCEDPHAAQIFLPGGQAPRAGEVLRQPALARTLRTIGEGGREPFYRGEVGSRLVEGLETLGGKMSADDLSAYTCRDVEPLSVQYRGHTVYQIPPNSWGLLHLLQLRVLEGFDLASLGAGSPRLLHLQMEAQRLAFAEGKPFIADPEHADFPFDHLLSRGFADSLRDRIHPNRATAAQATSLETSTSYLATADDQGTLVSLIQSVFQVFGSGVVAGDTGILLNDRLMGFTLEENHANALAPGKRPAHTLSPALICEDGRPRFALGSPGGAAQTATATQVTCYLLDFGLSPQEAVERPRWSVDGTGRVSVEQTFPPETRDALAAIGHEISLMPAGSLLPGSAKVAAIDHDTGALMAAADGRRDGYALGL